MPQRLTRCNPFPRIKMCHGTYKAFKVIINTIPEREWLAQGPPVESVPSRFENANPWIVTEVLQEPIEAIFIREVRNLALDDDSERIDTLFQLVFSNCENDALMNSADALGSQLLAALNKFPDGGLTTRANEKISEGLLTGPLAWASGLLHIQLPACLPTISHPWGIWAASSRSPS